VVYEWEPVSCRKCKGYGHETISVGKGLVGNGDPNTSNIQTKNHF